MRYTIEGFSQTEAIKFRRVETVRDSKGNDKEKVVTLDCTDLVILRWFVDFWPNMMKVEISGQQYAWLSYKAAIEDMPLLGIKKGMFALRLKKLVDFGILSHQTVRNGGTFSYYGFGPEYSRLIDSKHSQQTSDHAQNISDPLPKKLDTPTQNFSDLINPNTKDPSTKDNPKKETKRSFVPPTIEEVRDYVKENRFIFDADEFFAYYASQGWRKANGQKVVSWKQCCVTWERREQKNSKGGKRKPTQQKLEISEPRIGTKREDNMTGRQEVYKGNGVWEEYVSDYVPQEGDVDIDF